MKVMLLSNQARSMFIFWRVLIKAMQRAGMATVCCVPPGDADSDHDLENLGCQVIHYDLDRKGLNPAADLRTLAQFKKLFATEKPDLIFATTIKPVIYGGIAARLARVPAFYATITGLGYAFERDSVIKKLIGGIAARLYRSGLAGAAGVFFQNREDSALFQNEGLLNADAPVFYARGTGVDTQHFAEAPLPAGPVTFLLSCRLLEAKGIAEFAWAARILKRDFPDARFQLLGAPESGRGSVSLEQVRQWQEEGLIEYLGQTTDVRPYIANAHVAVLPSWREGTPTALLEAMSMGRPLVATDAPGCREVVRPGENGYLAPVKNPAGLAAAMRGFLEDAGLAKRMGAISRALACREFDANVVAAGILADITASLPEQLRA